MLMLLKKTLYATPNRANVAMPAAKPLKRAMKIPVNAAKIAPTTTATKILG